MAFLHAEFACICTYHPALISVVNWPSQKVIRHLTVKSSQRFIYAATVVKFVGDPRYNSIQRLDAILSTSTEAPLSPFINLDTLYHQILGAAQLENIDATLTIFGMLEFCPKPLTLANIAGFMALSIQDVNLLLYNLHSIIKISDLNSEVKFFHASFSDFLTSGLTLLSDRRPQRPILLMVVIGLWGCFRSVTALPNPNLVASFTNV